MIETQTSNIDPATVEGFGDEWARFDQTGMSHTDTRRLFDRYFSIFPWDSLPAGSIGFDLGCGSGRWARLVAPRVGTLHCIDPSTAIDIARRVLSSHDNCVFHQASAETIPLKDRSMDFGYSLGVLHHVPDTPAALASCVAKLKPGAPFLIYLYYAFDNRPLWFRLIWKLSDWVRRVVSRLPHGLRFIVSQIIAGAIYWPLARIAKIAERLGVDVRNYPLAPYRHCGFYVMRTDALDRFGTRLEKRFTKFEIRTMMEGAGLENIEFNEKEQFWCALGYAK